MTVRLPHAFVGALCLGFALANVARPGMVSTLGAAAALAALGLAAPGSRLRAAALASAVVVVAWGWGSMRLTQLDHSVLASRIGTAEWAVVEVEEPPRPGSFDQRMKALVLRWGTLRVREPVLLQLPLGRSPPQGARLRLLGELKAPPGPSNGFDEATWLRRQGIHAVLHAQSFRVVGRRGGVSGIGDRVGRWLSGDTTPGLSGTRADVIEAIVLGRTSGVDQGLLADFRATGLYHCLAVDGLKVAAVGGGAAAVVLLLGLGIYVAQLAALATVAAYALAVGLHPSVVRAAIAACLGSLAWLAGRERDRWQALLVGAAVLLGWNPYRCSTPASSSRSPPSRRSSSSRRASSARSRDTRCRTSSRSSSASPRPAGWRLLRSPGSSSTRSPSSPSRRTSWRSRSSSRCSASRS